MDHLKHHTNEFSLIRRIIPHILDEIEMRVNPYSTVYYTQNARHFIDVLEKAGSRYYMPVIDRLIQRVQTNG